MTNELTAKIRSGSQDSTVSNRTQESTNSKSSQSDRLKRTGTSHHLKRLNVSKRSGLVSYTDYKAATKICNLKTPEKRSKNSTSLTNYKNIWISKLPNTYANVHHTIKPTPIGYNDLSKHMDETEITDDRAVNTCKTNLRSDSKASMLNDSLAASILNATKRTPSRQSSMNPEDSLREKLLKHYQLEDKNHQFVTKDGTRIVMKKQNRSKSRTNSENKAQNENIEPISKLDSIVHMNQKNQVVTQKFPFYPASVNQINEICNLSTLPSNSNALDKSLITKSKDGIYDSNMHLQASSQSGAKQPISNLLSYLDDKFLISKSSTFASNVRHKLAMANSRKALSQDLDAVNEVKIELKKTTSTRNSVYHKKRSSKKTSNKEDRKRSSSVFIPSPLFNVRSTSTTNILDKTNQNNSIRKSISHLEEKTATTPKKLDKILHVISTFLFSHIGVLLLLFFYTIAGALIFQKIEGPMETETVNKVILYRQLTALDLAVQIKVTGIELVDMEQLIEKTLKQYQDKLITYVEHGFDGHEDSVNNKWSFAGAILYCVTVITTIGYGKTAPISNLGRMLTVFYAIIGIPLLVLFLSNFGALLAVAFKWMCRKITSKCWTTHSTKSRTDNLLSYTVTRDMPIERNIASKKKLKDADLNLNNNNSNDLKSQPCNEDIILDMESEDSVRKMQNQRLMDKTTCKEKKVNGRKRSNTNHTSSDDIKQNESQNAKNSNNEKSDEESMEEQDTETNAITEILDSKDFKNYQVPVWACLLLMFGYLILGSISFSFWEGWDAVTSFYFCFITLSTIGFGDIVPGADLFSVNAIEKLLFVSFYIIFGMALVSMCFTLMQQTIIKTLKEWGTKLGLW